MKNSLYSRRHNPKKFSDTYEVGKKLGEGNFAVVHEVVSKVDKVRGGEEREMLLKQVLDVLKTVQKNKQKKK